MSWLSLLPAILTIAIAVWSKKIIPALLMGLLTGGYLLHPTITGGVETAVDWIVDTLTDRESLQVLLFLYLFSGLIGIVKRAGGIQAFSRVAERHIDSERGVFFALWALIPLTFIDCGFRIVGAGSITRPLAERKKIPAVRLAFMLSNTASPLVELVPVATTFVGFNVAIIALGLKAAGVAETTSAYGIWLRAIPLEFFSIVVLAITFLSIFIQLGRAPGGSAGSSEGAMKDAPGMEMAAEAPVIQPRVVNLAVPLLSVILLSLFFFWFFGSKRSGDVSVITAMTNTEPNKAMLIALFISLIVSGILYSAQTYGVGRLAADVISGGNEIMPTLVILTLAWPLAGVSQALGLSDFIQQHMGAALPAWSLAFLLFLTSSVLTYFIGSGWGTASLLMPIAIPLAFSAQSSIPLCVAAVITGGTFGDVTSPVAGMTNMASNVAHADHAAFVKYATPYNLLAGGIAGVLFLIAGLAH